jgi:hypothetical protein
METPPWLHREAERCSTSTGEGLTCGVDVRHRELAAPPWGVCEVGRFVSWVCLIRPEARVGAGDCARLWRLAIRCPPESLVPGFGRHAALRGRVPTTDRLIPLRPPAWSFPPNAPVTMRSNFVAHSHNTGSRGADAGSTVAGRRDSPARAAAVNTKCVALIRAAFPAFGHSTTSPAGTLFQPSRAPTDSRGNSLRPRVTAEATTVAVHASDERGSRARSRRGIFCPIGQSAAAGGGASTEMQKLLPRWLPCAAGRAMR